MKYILSITALIVAALALYLSYKEQKEVKTAYVDTIYLYENSELQKHYKQELEGKIKRNKFYVDSLFNANKQQIENDINVRKSFLQEKERCELEIVNVEKEYDSKIWNQLSELTIQYGKTNNYEFIFGANGAGSLMYSASNKNISKEVLDFINKKFEGE